jgi:hypothetical protein
MLFAAEELDELKRAFAQHLEEGPVGHMAAMALVLMVDGSMEPSELGTLSGNRWEMAMGE